MANTKTTGDYKNYITIDTSPGSAGFFTDAISERTERLQDLFFSMRGNGIGIVTVQFKHQDDSTWTDYDTYTDPGRYAIRGGAAGIIWRAGIISGNYTSGTIITGFDW